MHMSSLRLATELRLGRCGLRIVAFPLTRDHSRPHIARDRVISSAEPSTNYMSTYPPGEDGRHALHYALPAQVGTGPSNLRKEV